MLHCRAGARADQDEHGHECNVREARNEDHQACDPARGRQARREHDQPDQSADPDRSRDEVEPVENQREAAGRSLSGVPGEARHQQASGRCAEGAGERDQGRKRALTPLGPVEPDRNRGGPDEEREHELEVEPAAAEGRAGRGRRSSRRIGAQTPPSRAGRRPGSRGAPAPTRRRRQSSRTANAFPAPVPRPASRRRSAGRRARSPPSARGTPASARSRAAASRQSPRPTGSRTAVPAPRLVRRRT